MQTDSCHFCDVLCCFIGDPERILTSADILEGRVNVDIIQLRNLLAFH